MAAVAAPYSLAFCIESSIISFFTKGLAASWIANRYDSSLSLFMHFLTVSCLSAPPSTTIISLLLESKNDDEGKRMEKNELIAQKLFSTLRLLDDQEVDVILIEGITEEYRGLAVMNRLRKACSRNS